MSYRTRGEHVNHYHTDTVPYDRGTTVQYNTLEHNVCVVLVCWITTHHLYLSTPSPYYSSSVIPDTTLGRHHACDRMFQFTTTCAMSAYQH